MMGFSKAGNVKEIFPNFSPQIREPRTRNRFPFSVGTTRDRRRAHYRLRVNMHKAKRQVAKPVFVEGQDSGSENPRAAAPVPPEPVLDPCYDGPTTSSGIISTGGRGLKQANQSRWDSDSD
ncbi:hypothetical protein KR018_010918 [Drosophila ironensis]|nr:hypothetical protein KR018_010918 [Drosophila ironensis]